MSAVEPFFAFYRGKKVLVTGDTGFKGSWICEWLIRLGADVTGLGLPPTTKPSLFNILPANRYPHHEIDVRDHVAVNELIMRAEPDVIFHMAAQALVRRSHREPVATVATNVLGTAHVLDAALTVSQKRPCAVVVVTSDKCYQNLGLGLPFREHDPLGGNDVYSASKGAAELLVSGWRSSFSRVSEFPNAFAVASARAGNVLGGGDWAEDRLVPDFVRAIADNQVLAVRHPSATRPWQHVLEPLAGYLLLGSGLRKAPEQQSSWNFGPDEDSVRTVGEVCDSVARAWGKGTWHKVPEPSDLQEAHDLTLSIEKSKERLGWRPVWGFDDTISQTVKWYRIAYESRFDPSEMRNVSLAQIGAYLEGANNLDMKWAGGSIERGQT